MLKQILQKLLAFDPEQLTEGVWTKVTFERIIPLEQTDLEEQVFKRRMGMRAYFKELKNNTKRIQETKNARLKAGKPNKNAKKSNKITE